MHQAEKSFLAATAVVLTAGAAVEATQPLGHYPANQFNNPDLTYLPTISASLLVLGIGLAHAARFMRR